MKFIFFALLFSTLSMAGEIQTTLSEHGDGLSFSLYELSNDGEATPLRDFANSLNQTSMMTTDKVFSFRCKQKTLTKSVSETRCSGVLKDSTFPTARGTFGDDYINIVLNGKAAEEFFNVLPKDSWMVSVSVGEKLVIAGTKTTIGILVRH